LLALQHPGQGLQDFVEDQIYHDGVMVVASHSLSALQYAASELRSDRSLVLEAVKVNGRAP